MPTRLIVIISALALLLVLMIVSSIFIHKKMETFTNREYAPIEYPGFITPEECDALIEFAKKKGLVKSELYEGTKDVVDNSTRLSEQTWLADNDHPVVKSISDKVSKIVGLPVQNFEMLQVLHYGKGGKYDPHFDACEEKEKGFCDRMNIGGPRLKTFIIYLNDDYEGGGTHFPKINYTVIPKKGKAVLFENVDANHVIIPEALHGGQPVLNGEKWIANKWIHAGPFMQS